MDGRRSCAEADHPADGLPHDAADGCHHPDGADGRRSCAEADHPAGDHHSSWWWAIPFTTRRTAVAIPTGWAVTIAAWWWAIPFTARWTAVAIPTGRTVTVAAWRSITLWSITIAAWWWAIPFTTRRTAVAIPTGWAVTVAAWRSITLWSITIAAWWWAIPFTTRWTAVAIPAGRTVTVAARRPITLRAITIAAWWTIPFTARRTAVAIPTGRTVAVAARRPITIAAWWWAIPLTAWWTAVAIPAGRTVTVAARRSITLWAITIAAWWTIPFTARRTAVAIPTGRTITVAAFRTVVKLTYWTTFFSGFALVASYLSVDLVIDVIGTTPSAQQIIRLALGARARLGLGIARAFGAGRILVVGFRQTAQAHANGFGRAHAKHLDFCRGHFAEFAGLQSFDAERAHVRTHQLDDPMAQRRGNAPDLALLAFDHYDTQHTLVVRAVKHFHKTGRAAAIFAQIDAALPFIQHIGRRPALNGDAVLLGVALAGVG